MTVTEILTLPKKTHLKSKVLIDGLFNSGKSEKAGPVIVLWNNAELPNDEPIHVGFSVPKRKFKRAVDRNRIKRQMREVYRMNQTGLYRLLKDKEQQLAIFIIYRGSHNYTYKALEGKIIVILKRLENELRKELNNDQ
ncbi:MAG: ribonuclease P protein component [Parvicellaceae bacterium]